MTSHITVHTSRTIMFAELAKVMDYAVADDSYLASLKQNIAGKRTKSNQDKTTGFLTKLYSFDLDYLPFRVFKHFWAISEREDRPLLAFLLALTRDYLLKESVPIVLATRYGEKVTIEALEQNIEFTHPKQFTPNTRRSLAQNIASSWKQAGFIVGKVKNIRTRTSPSCSVVAFAVLLAYLDGLRGDYLLTSPIGKVLDLSEQDLRDLLFEAAKSDLLQYQYSGSVTTVSFRNLFRRIGIDGIED
jgi:hypothetical protein